MQNQLPKGKEHEKTLGLFDLSILGIGAIIGTGILVLTGIVVSVSVTAIMLALTIRLYARYHTLNLDEIFEKIHKNEDKGE